jgi:hypothetical protein
MKAYWGYYLLGIMMILLIAVDVLLAWIGRLIDGRKSKE